jgi:hypothetical protein
MTVYNTNPDQCELNMSYENLLYVIALNATFIFLPVVVLVGLYITIIIKSWSNYRNHVKMCSLSRNGSLKRKENNSSILKETYTVTNSVNNINVKLLNRSSLISLDNVMRYKAKKTFNSTFKISTVTILAFFFQLPRRVFLCWSYLNSYRSILDTNYFENFFEYYSNSINPIFYINVTNLIYLLYLIFNSIIYNIFSVKFRSTLKNFLK